MNNLNQLSLAHPNQNLRQISEDRFGLKLASRLSDASGSLPHDISERLRVARLHAVTAHKAVAVKTSRSLVGLGSVGVLSFGDEDISLWNRIASAIPLIALLVGLVAIQVVQNDNRANEVAEVDAALLTDDLPPDAFTDPGFAQFLKANRSGNE